MQSNMTEKKGYGLIIPSDWGMNRWYLLSSQDVINQLSKLTCDTFYRMAEEVGIDIALLKESGYEFSGVSELSIIELEACLSKEKVDEIKGMLTLQDYVCDADFRYMFHLYDDKTGIIDSLYSPEVTEDIKQAIKYSLREERERMLQLMALFIDEFEDDKTDARREVLKKYGGHFISMPEFESFLSYRDDVAWYRGDTFNPEYKDDIDRMKAMRELVPLYKLIHNGGEFQVQSTTLKHQKVTLNEGASEILADAIALTLKMLHDADPMLTTGADVNKTFTWVDLVCARERGDVDEILESVNWSIDSYESEFDLSLFYYLADNAIHWPADITLTKRYLFLYRLAKFFKFIPENEYDEATFISSRKEIVEAIKYQIKQIKKKDKDGELLERYRMSSTL